MKIAKYYLANYVKNIHNSNLFCIFEGLKLSAY